MKTYIGTKVIQAEPMDELAAMQKLGRDISPILVGSSGLTRQGYIVKYPDGYTSWSPKEQFDIAYREITVNEIKMLGGVDGD